MRVIPIDINTASRVTVEVKVVGMREWKLRCWIMMACFRMAAWIAPKNIAVEIQS